jgi:alpha-1,2-mannosyltransferase
MSALPPLGGSQPDSGARSLSPPLRLGMVILLLGLGIGAVVSRATSFSSDILTHNDFTQDYVATKAWSEGIDPYSPTAGLVDRYLGDDATSYRIQYEDRRNPHPPIQIVLLRPLGLFDYRQARLAWLALMSFLLSTSIMLVLRESGFRTSTAIVGGIAVLALPVMQQDLIWAQINGVILLLLVLGWRAIRGEREMLAGMVLGLATAIKLYPLLFIIPLLRMRRFRAAAWQVGTAAIVGLVGVFLIGLNSFETYLRIAAPDNLEYWRAAPMNLSITSAPFRWLTNSVWRQPSVQVSYLPEALALVAMIACVIAVARTPVRVTKDLYWAAAPWMLLAAPLAWSFTLSLMLPYLVIIVLEGFRARGLPHLAVFVPVVVIAATPIPGLPIPGPTNSIVTILLGFGLPTYALMLLGSAEWKTGLTKGTLTGRDDAEDPSRGVESR